MCCKGKYKNEILDDLNEKCWEEITSRQTIKWTASAWNPPAFSWTYEDVLSLYVGTTYIVPPPPPAPQMFSGSARLHLLVMVTRQLYSCYLQEMMFIQRWGFILFIPHHFLLPLQGWEGYLSRLSHSLSLLCLLAKWSSHYEKQIQ